MRILRTRDGRKIGNGIIIQEITEGLKPSSAEYLEQTSQKLWLVETDFGNRLRLTDREIDNYFFKPEELSEHMRIMTTVHVYETWSRDRHALIFQNTHPEPKEETDAL